MGWLPGGDCSRGWAVGPPEKVEQCPFLLGYLWKVWCLMWEGLGR